MEISTNSPKPFGELYRQPPQFLYPVAESPFLCGLVIELAPALLPLSVVKHAQGDIVHAAELRRAAFAAHEFLNYLTLKLQANSSLISRDKVLSPLGYYTLTLPDLLNIPNLEHLVSGS